MDIYLVLYFIIDQLESLNNNNNFQLWSSHEYIKYFSSIQYD
jgi:hypothetical protein